VYALDFSKAFDTVRHHTMLQKMADLDQPDNIYNWLVTFFENHSHSTKFGDECSPILNINSSVIQGSAVGPAAYVVNASDLHPLHSDNTMDKYADDTYLIIPASMVGTREAELTNVVEWADVNNLRLNHQKSYEIVFTCPADRNHESAQPPPPLSDIVRVSQLKVLGVTIMNNFSMRAHVDATLSSCQSTLFALRTLRSHGMNAHTLQMVFSSVIVAKIMYGSAAWYGFTDSTDRARLDSLLRKSKKSGFNASEADFSSMCCTADNRLFKTIISNPHHVLFSLLPPKVIRTHNLCPRPHPFTLPNKSTKLIECNFVSRLLYTYKRS